MATNEKKKKPFDYNTTIIMSSMMVLVVRYVGAFIASDMTSMPDWLSGILTFGIGVSGLGMGLLDGLGGAVIFQGWRVALPKRDQRWPFKFIILTIFVALMIINGVFIMLPYTVMRTAGVHMTNVLGNENNPFLWLWGIAVNIAPYLVIGGAMASSNVNFDLERANALDKNTEISVQNDTKNNGNQQNNEHGSNDQNNQVVKSWIWEKESAKFDETTFKVIAKLEKEELMKVYPGLSDQMARRWRRRSIIVLINMGHTIDSLQKEGIKIKKTDIPDGYKEPAG